MKIFLIILFILICLPVQAEQFKQFGGMLINKNAVSKVYLLNNSIALNFIDKQNTSYIIPAENKQERIKKFNEIKQWLNSKD